MDHLTLSQARTISALSASLASSDECSPQVITVRHRSAYWVARAYALHGVTRCLAVLGF